MEKSWWTYAYLVDWTIAIALSGAAVLLQVFHNSRPELDSTFVVDDQTVTIFGLYAITLIVPFVTIVLYQGFIVFWVHWIRRASEHRDVAMIHEIHNGFLGLTSGFGLTAIIIESIYMILAKVPNSACQGKSECANETGKVYPSIYAGYTFLGMTYLGMYISRKVRSNNASIVWLFINILPFLVSTLVCISQINQGRTTLVNVLFGIVIGMAMAISCYRIYFNPEGNVRATITEPLQRKENIEEGSIYSKQPQAIGKSSPSRKNGSNSNSKNSSIRSY